MSEYLTKKLKELGKVTFFSATFLSNRADILHFFSIANSSYSEYILATISTVKFLEAAYQNEKQSYKRMHDELKTVRRGQSRIPISTKRSRITTRKDTEFSSSKVL